MKLHPPVLNRKHRATRTGLLCTALLAATAFTAHAQNTGFGTTTPASKVTVNGNFAVGKPPVIPSGPKSPYITTAAPVGGAIIEGLTGLGVINPLNQLHVFAAADPVRFEGLQFSTNTADAPLVVQTDGVVKKADWDWRGSAPLVITSSTGVNPTYTAAVSVTEWRKFGPDLEVRAKLYGSSGTTGGGDHVFHLPPGLSFNLAKTPAFTGAAYDPNGNPSNAPAVLDYGIPVSHALIYYYTSSILIVPYTATTYRVFFQRDGTIFGFLGANYNGASGYYGIAQIGGTPYSWQFTLPQ